MAYIQAQTINLLNAVSATATSNWVGVQNAGRISIQYLASGIVVGNGVFTVEISNDPTNLGATAYNRLTSNVTNASNANDTRVASLTLSTNTTNFVFIPPGDTFGYFRTKLAFSTDGTYSATAYID